VSQRTGWTIAAALLLAAEVSPTFGQQFVVLGQAIPIQTPYKRTFDSPKTSDESVCEATQWFVSKGKQTVKLTGKKLGTVTLIVAGTNSESTDKNDYEYMTYRITVVRDTAKLNENLDIVKTHFRVADFKMSWTSDTSKVILTGTVPNSSVAEQIVALIESPDLPRSAIINRLTVPECPTPDVLWSDAEPELAPVPSARRFHFGGH
jgi:Flp pilus assembly secretin CpaC